MTREYITLQADTYCDLLDENAMLRKRLRQSKVDNRTNRDRLRKQVKQLETVGFTQGQLWNLDHHLANIILKGLKGFKAMKRNGYPGSFYVEWQDETIAMKQWEDTLDKMILAFEILANEDMLFHHHKPFVKEGLSLFAKHFLSLWD